MKMEQKREYFSTRLIVRPTFRFDWWNYCFFYATSGLHACANFRRLCYYIRMVCECSQKWNWKSTVHRILMCQRKKVMAKSQKQFLLSISKHERTFASVV